MVVVQGLEQRRDYLWRVRRQLPQARELFALDERRLGFAQRPILLG